MTSVSSGIAFDHVRHLGEERLRMLDLLASLLDVQRRRGRTPATDGVRSLMIEDGEAEGLIDELARSWSGDTENGRGRARTADQGRRDEITRRADDAAARGARLPLWFVRRAFDLTDAEYDAVLLTLLVECDARVGRLAAYLNDHVGQARPTVGLVQSLAELQGIDADTLAWRDRPILADGLLTLEGDGPLPERSLRIDHRQAQRLATMDPGHEPTVMALAPEPGLLDRLVLDQATRDVVLLWAERVELGAAPPLVVVTGPDGSGRTTLIHAAASALGRPVIAPAGDVRDLPAVLRLLRRESRWYGAHVAAPVGPDADPAEFWRHIGDPPGYVFVELREAQLQRFLGAAPFEPEVWPLANPGPADRAELWHRLMPPGLTLDPADADALAAAFRVGPAAIARAVRRADAERGVKPLDRHALAAAARRQVGQALADLADRLPLAYARKDLVVPDDTAREIDLAMSWMRHQPQVLDRWGLGRRVAGGRGLTVLFAGPPGTGKTMAAQVLAHELELDCYRIDLSRVISKWIGETEQNLARLFDEAEPGGAVLFFDEADALFGKRAEVKDARDRYANIEVGYLLQRMEQYDGVAVLATNRAADMDDAFMRRFQVVARFRLPDPGERLRIWRGLLPPDGIEDGLDVAAIAQAVELSGGEIKNCVLAASYLAAAEGGRIALRHLVQAVRREVGKSGRLVDEAALARLA